MTIDQIKDAFKRRLSPDKFVTVTVGPRLDEKGSEKDNAAGNEQKVKPVGGSS